MKPDDLCLQDPQPHRPRCRRLDGVHLARVPFIPPAARKRLAQVGVDSVGRLLTTSPQILRERLRLSSRQAAHLDAYCTSLNLAAVLPEATFREARMLVAIYRSQLWKIAAESPAVLQRDLRRLHLSSSSRRIFRGSPPPSRQRLERLVEAARRRSR